MRFWVGVTNNRWYSHLASIRPDEVNFWRPSSTAEFRAIEPGAPFLFKLHDRQHRIAGGGFFVRHSILPLSLAWRAFGEKNGTSDFQSLLAMVNRLRAEPRMDPPIGCTILSSPFFWDEPD